MTRLTTITHREPWRIPMWLGLCAFLTIAGFFLWEEHRAHLLGALPYVLLLLCPVIHLFMHRGHGTDDLPDVGLAGGAVSRHRSADPRLRSLALLELIRQSFCSHVKVLPKGANVVFGGGFPREDDPTCRRAAQRAIFYVQHELEIAADNHNPAVVLCDRGTIDGLAYWPGPSEDFYSSVGTTLETELGRYDAVIHLRTPAEDHGYNHQNPLRTESAGAAADINARIARAWERHPRRFFVESSAQFLDKAARALDLLQAELPECCKGHVVPAVRDRHHESAVGESIAKTNAALGIDMWLTSGAQK